jgi:hypothetical protein
VLGRLRDKGMIDDPAGKIKSVVFTQEGLERAKTLFQVMFEKQWWRVGWVRRSRNPPLGK